MGFVVRAGKTDRNFVVKKEKSWAQCLCIFELPANFSVRCKAFQILQLKRQAERKFVSKHFLIFELLSL